MVKRNKRQKAWVGALVSALGALGNMAVSAINNENIIASNAHQMALQKAAAIRNSNAENTSILQSNLYGLANNQQEERSRIIPTQESAFKLGGRRCKKCGGGRLTKFI